MQRVGYALEACDLQCGFLVPATVQSGNLLQTFQKKISEDRVNCSSDMLVTTC
jgi:hypothetical protein